jgi:hypothetical protein
MKFIGVSLHTDSRSLQDQWRTQSTTRNNNLLPRTISLRDILSRSQRLCGYSLNTDGTTVFDNDLVNFSVADKMEVLMDRSGAVDVAVSRV